MKNCLSSHGCHFVKNYIFCTKLLHVYVQCVYVIKAKYEIALSKAVIGVDWSIKALSCIYKCHISEKLSKFSYLSFWQKSFFLNQTPLCICSICLHCSDKVSNCSIKSCSRSWSTHKGSIHAYTKAIKVKNSLSSYRCHFIKKYFFLNQTPHTYVQCVYIV